MKMKKTIFLKLSHSADSKIWSIAIAVVEVQLWAWVRE